MTSTQLLLAGGISLIAITALNWLLLYKSLQRPFLRKPGAIINVLALWAAVALTAKVNSDFAVFAFILQIQNLQLVLGPFGLKGR